MKEIYIPVATKNKDVVDISRANYSKGIIAKYEDGSLAGLVVRYDGSGCYGVINTDGDGIEDEPFDSLLELIQDLKDLKFYQL